MPSRILQDRITTNAAETRRKDRHLLLLNSSAFTIHDGGFPRSQERGLIEAGTAFWPFTWKVGQLSGSAADSAADRTRISCYFCSLICRFPYAQGRGACQAVEARFSSVPAGFRIWGLGGAFIEGTF